jgi:uncharacterized membrane protein YkvI
MAIHGRSTPVETKKKKSLLLNYTDDLESFWYTLLYTTYTFAISLLVFSLFLVSVASAGSAILKAIHISYIWPSTKLEIEVHSVAFLDKVKSRRLKLVEQYNYITSIIIDDLMWAAPHQRNGIPVPGFT